MDKYVISSDEIAELEGTPKSHYLNPKARRINKSLGDLTGLTGFGIHIISFSSRPLQIWWRNNVGVHGIIRIAVARDRCNAPLHCPQWGA